jgi:choice-of-anchor A domain-containing protein
VSGDVSGDVSMGHPLGTQVPGDHPGLENLSTRLATQPSTGTTQHNSWSVTMNGTDPCLNVFTVNASGCSCTVVALLSMAEPQHRPTDALLRLR